MPTLTQWQNTWQMLGINPEQIPSTLYVQLMASYSELHRHYHTLQHLDECLTHFAELRHLTIYPAEAELALWFHDAIYDPTGHDNEQRSTDWAVASLKAVGLNETICTRFAALIMATRHQQVPQNKDAEVILDCDLAILGAIPERFADYEQQIRAEYAFVPSEIFNKKRAEILQQFLDRPAIFNTAEFVDRYETQARNNLTKAIRQLT